jgi:hypothetical protein
MIEENVLEQRFWAIAEREAAERSIKITPDGAAYLKSFIHDGVSKLLAEGSVNDQSIELAESNLIKFMAQSSALLSEEMTSLNRGRENRGIPCTAFSSELSKRIFMRSKISICPCWPFC